MKDLLKQAFQAGRDFGHAMGTGRPTYGLTFDEWYSENENQVLSIANVSGSDLLSKARQMRLEQQRKIDSYTEYYNTYEIGTLNGIDGMVKLIEQHSR